MRTQMLCASVLLIAAVTADASSHYFIANDAVLSECLPTEAVTPAQIERRLASKFRGCSSQVDVQGTIMTQCQGAIGKSYFYTSRTKASCESLRASVANLADTVRRSEHPKAPPVLSNPMKPAELFGKGRPSFERWARQQFLVDKFRYVSDSEIWVALSDDGRAKSQGVGLDVAQTLVQRYKEFMDIADEAVTVVVYANNEELARAVK